MLHTIFLVSGMVEGRLILASPKNLTRNLMSARMALNILDLGLLQKITLSPHNAVYRLARRTPNRADWERLRGLFRCAIVACRYSLLDDLHLAIKACCSTLN